MLIPDYEISLAMPDDILGMVALQEVNLPDKGGSLSVRLKACPLYTMKPEGFP